MQDEEPTVHDLAEMIEDVDRQIDEQVQHLVADALISNAHQTWLQRAH